MAKRKSEPQTVFELAQGVVPILRRILAENGREYARYYIIAIICLVLVGLTSALAAWVIGDVVDEIFYRQRAELIAGISALVAGIFIVRGLAMYFQAVIMARIGNDLVARYQRRVFQKLTRLDMSYIDQARSGRLAAQIAANIGGIRDVLSLTITSLARDVVSLVGLVTVMVVQDPLLSLIALLGAPILVGTVAYVSFRVRSLVRESVEIGSRVMGTMQESIQGMTIVKAFTMEEQLGAKINENISRAQERADKLASVTERVNPAAEVLAGFAIGGVIAYGGYNAVFADRPPGTIMSFITAFLLAYDPARRLANLKVNLERAMVNARMLYEVIDMPERQRDKPDAKPLAITQGEIVFDTVDFAYSDGSKVLHGLSFTAEPNKTTAIVGPSGAGKSTVISLIQRFYAPTSGAIRIDGQDIADVTSATLRGQIAFVSQQPYLFEGSIADNIRYGRPDATDEEIEAAARQANAHDFIVAQQQGYDTPLGENGVTLSGGQRQRVSIARAIVRNAPILLLDEATSALDNESEKLVQAALETVMAGRTTVVIAHRLSTIMSADSIVVMDNGRVVETGRHTDLAGRQDGLYARLNALGMAGGASEDDDTDQPDQTETVAAGGVR